MDVSDVTLLFYTKGVSLTVKPQLQVSKGAVHVTLKHFAETESAVSEARSDRPEVTTPPEDQYIKLSSLDVMFVLACVCYSVYTSGGVNITFFRQISCDLSMTRSALIGWGCLLSRLLVSCSGWPRPRTPSLCWEGGS